MTIDDVAARKKIEFKQKLNALEEEFTEWCDISIENKPFEKHNTQIRAIQTHLKTWNESIKFKLKEYDDIETEKFLENCKNAENLILSEHRIWDYFRDKFIQRKNESFHKYLKVADEFAWACYEPILKETKLELKEPPLVYFNGGKSPFAVSRKRMFQIELVDEEDISSKISDYEIDRLPISVIGIPWDQINHLPEASVIGHEVGHIVQNDFKLTKDLERIFENALNDANANNSRKEAWDSWMAEIFGDFYGCLAVGPAFAGTLLDFLVDEKSIIEKQNRKASNWEAYPTDILRMKIIVKILTKMGFQTEVSDYAEIYSTYKSNMPKEFESDIDFIVGNLLTEKFEKLNNKSLPDVFTFTTDQQIDVVNTNYKLSQNTPMLNVILDSSDIRVLFATNRYSFEKSPQQHIDNNYDDVVVNWINTKVIERGERSGYVSTNFDEKLKKYEEISKGSIAELIDKHFT